MDIYSTEWQENTYRSKQQVLRVFRIIKHPIVFFTLILFVCYGMPDDLVPTHLASMWGSFVLFYTGTYAILMPLYIVGRVIRFFYDQYKQVSGNLAHERAVAIPKATDNAQSIAYIKSSYPKVFEGAGLTRVDLRGNHAKNAAISTASVYGKGRVAKIASHASLLTDAFAGRECPELVAIDPVDQYSTRFVFEMLHGQTSSMFEDRHEEISSGFRVPRVAVSQSTAEKTSGLVCITAYHQDLLEQSEAFDTSAFDTSDWIEA